MKYVSVNTQLVLAGVVVLTLVAVVGFHQQLPAYQTVVLLALFSAIFVCLACVTADVVRSTKKESSVTDQRTKFMVQSVGLIGAFMPASQRDAWSSTWEHLHQERSEVEQLRKRLIPEDETYAQTMERLTREEQEEQRRLPMLMIAAAFWRERMLAWILELEQQLPNKLAQGFPPEDDQRPMTQHMRERLQGFQEALPNWIREARSRVNRGHYSPEDWRWFRTFVGELEFAILAAQDQASA